MYNIYTDGASRGNPGRSSWAFVVYSPEGEELGSKKAAELASTNNAMELRAILHAMQHVNKNIDRYSKAGGVNIFTDSAFAINVITQWMEGWHRNGWTKKTPGPIKNLELIQNIYNEYNMIQMSTSVVFVKVAGHSGNTGNERADALCNQALDELN